MKISNRVIWGIILILVGVIFALNALNITEIDIFFEGWWTLFIIVPSLVGLVRGPDRMGSFIGLGIGVLLLLNSQGLLDLGKIWELIVPAIIILIGVKLVFGGIFNGRAESVSRQAEGFGKAQHSGFAAFTGTQIDFDGQSFHGAELNAIFGGIDYDLRNAIIAEDCVIRATAIFGGIDILLPPDVQVMVTSNSVFGGVGNKHSNPAGTENVTVHIIGAGIFGGVDIQ